MNQLTTRLATGYKIPLQAAPDPDPDPDSDIEDDIDFSSSLDVSSVVLEAVLAGHPDLEEIVVVSGSVKSSEIVLDCILEGLPYREDESAFEDPEVETEVEPEAELETELEAEIQEVLAVQASAGTAAAASLASVPPTPLPKILDHLMISDIMDIHTAAEFRSMFGDFERQVEAKLVPLKAYLRKVIMTQEVAVLETHAANVERYRSDVTKYWSLAAGFVEHGRSSSFRLQQIGKGKITAPEHDSYRRTLTAGYAALAQRLECLVDDIDSRVNLCKKYDKSELTGFKTYGGRV